MPSELISDSPAWGPENMQRCVLHSMYTPCINLLVKWIEELKSEFDKTNIYMLENKQNWDQLIPFLITKLPQLWQKSRASVFLLHSKQSSDGEDCLLVKWHGIFVYLSVFDGYSPCKYVDESHQASCITGYFLPWHIYDSDLCTRD